MVSVHTARSLSAFDDHVALGGIKNIAPWRRLAATSGVAMLWVRFLGILCSITHNPELVR